MKLKSNLRFIHRLILVVIITCSFGIIIGIIFDHNWLKELSLHLPSEFIGVSIGIVVTIFFVERLLEKREEDRWKSLRKNIYSTLEARFDVMLSLLSSYIPLQKTNNYHEIYLEILEISNSSSNNIKKISSKIESKHIEHIVDILDYNIKSIIHKTDSLLYFLSDNPTLITLLIEIEDELNSLKMKLKFGPTGLSKDGVFTNLATDFPMIPDQLFKLLNIVGCISKEVKV